MSPPVNPVENKGSIKSHMVVIEDTLKLLETNLVNLVKQHKETVTLLESNIIKLTEQNKLLQDKIDHLEKA